MESSVLPGRSAERTTAEIARTTRVDPRLPETVPGFDAPFFQAGLAGYSDGAMRLIARRHGCPYCITEALLDQTLINGGKGRVREDPDLLASECGLGDPGANRLAGLDDHPIAGQVMGTDPEEMAIASSMLVDMNYDVIDINLACPREEDSASKAWRSPAHGSGSSTGRRVSRSGCRAEFDTRYGQDATQLR